MAKKIATIIVKSRPIGFRSYWPISIILLGWAIIFHPLLGERFIPTHDGEYHLIRMYEFFKMLAAGELFPRWAPTLNSGYGFPLFIFHYPFPNYVGSVFRFLGFPLVQSFQWSMAAGVLVGAISCYVFLKQELHEKAALVGALTFFTIPYLFVDVYIRGSIGEVWAVAWVFLSLAALGGKKNSVLALSVALIIISHNIMAMITLPILFVYTMIFYRTSLPFLFIGILGATYFWLPALAERAYVVGLNTVTYSDHFPTFVQLLFPSWGSTFSQPGMPATEMSQQLGIAVLCILILTVWGMIRHHEGDLHHKRVFFFISTIVAVVLLLPISQPVWDSLPFLHLIQYPWRLLSVLLVTVPFLAAVALTRVQPVMRWGILFLAFFLAFPYMKPVLYEPRNDEYYLSRREFTDGTSSMGNSFSTIWTSWKSKRPDQPVEVLSGLATMTDLSVTHTRTTFRLEAKSETKLRIHRLYYPGWTVTINNRGLPIDYTRDGTIQFTVPSGSYAVAAVFQGTPLRRVADTISLFSFGVLGILEVAKSRKSKA